LLGATSLSFSGAIIYFYKVWWPMFWNFVVYLLKIFLL
jgi:hypothetical protein